jgi:hypothetical protein
MQKEWDRRVKFKSEQDFPKKRMIQRPPLLKEEHVQSSEIPPRSKPHSPSVPSSGQEKEPDITEKAGPGNQTLIQIVVLPLIDCLNLNK